MELIGGSDLKRIWLELVADRGPLTCHDVLIEMKQRGLAPKGADYKGQIRNLHSAATALQLSRVKPGVFGPPTPSD